MPLKRKIEDPVEAHGEKEIKENLIPVNESDILHAVDVPVKSVEKYETIEKKGNTKKKTKKKSNKKVVKNGIDEFKIPKKIKLKEKGIILIITEKPQASIKISDALADGKIEKRSLGGVNYYEMMRNGKSLVVTCAVGHLFTLAQVERKSSWPVFNIQWAPNFLVKKNDFTKKYYNVIEKLSKQASEIVIATDYDIEGEVIGMNIVRYICNQDDANRMKFSTLTAKEIQIAFDNRMNSLDWKQGIAGETRHYLDWIYGINLSRAIMNAILSSGKFRLMSIGRIQGPALNIIVNKEKEIIKFKPEKYWQIFAHVSDENNLVEVKYVKDIKKENELEKFKNIQGKKGMAETKKSQHSIQPPFPFDLTSLQTEIYKFYKITPAKTLEIAQRLYLNGLISYPRTNSQKIPKEIGYEKIIERLKERFNFVLNITRKIPVEGKKTDPAHPSIFPTGEFHNLDGDEKKIYELIVRRFVSCFCDDAIIDDKKIEVDVDGKKFYAKGAEIKKLGWMEIYPNFLKEKELPDLNGEVEIKKINIEEKITQPPKRYTPASIISELEKRNLGTKATRASIIETLYQRGYIKGKSIEATPLGMALIDSLEKNCDIIIDEKLTRDIEKELDMLRASKDPWKKEKEIIEHTKGIIRKIGEKFSINKEKIGKDLILATQQLWDEQKKENELMECKTCNKGTLTIKYNKKSNRYFIACNNYPECKTTFTLPPNSFIKKSDKICDYCKFPMLISIKKAKKPWIFCFNPKCESRNRT
ncbi:MAG: DNA topoisomerase I [Candidatus Pacearchaeota archaeon]